MKSTMTNMAFLRKLKGLTQAEAAAELDVARESYNRVEKRERPLSDEFAAKASKFYNYPADQLLDEFDYEAYLRSEIPTGFLADLKNSTDEQVRKVWNFLRFLNAEADKNDEH